MIPKTLWAGIILVVAGCLALAGLNIYQWTETAPELTQEEDLVLHAYDVIATARALETTLGQAERGQRGFIITANPNYLDSYRAGIAGTPPLLAKLQQLTAANSVQRQRMPVLQQEVNRRLAILKQSLDLREHAGFDAARRLVESESRPRHDAGGDG